MRSVDSGVADKIGAQAAAWTVRAAEGPLDASTQAELDAWLSEDPKHLGAWVRAQVIWVDTDRLAALDAGGATTETVEQVRDFAWPRRVAAAAAAALLVASGVAAHDRLAGRITTDRGEIRRIALSDGSTIFLNADTALQVRFDDGERRIVMRRGEASFVVAKDAARPFVVEAGSLSARAVGTDFSVGIGAEGDIAVTVAEGLVKVTGDDGVGGGRMLRRDEQFVAATIGPRRTQLDPGEVRRQLAWRNGELIFRGQRLEVAAAEVNRYAEKPVVINDLSLGRAEFMGVFHVGDSRAFARGAAAAFNGEVTETPEAFVLARRQNSPSH